MAQWTIGQLAAATGVPTSKIRYWERKGLLPAPERSGGQRRYAPQAASRIARLRLCQEVGFTLEEIATMDEHRASSPDLWRDLVRAKLADIERQRAELDRRSERLAGVLSCAHADLPECPHFQEHVRDYLAARR
ncbi:MerR family transcriptional regulator [Streptomyces bingchenggensis BCW-1]|uniref:MerR family transcriptional regulator n=1 Tax=Streptomyces bingchenggensis (strain BCW-1) TaxID=749414 RepID=D7BSJ6_STRBB|nr:MULTISPECIES: MerR family transcriptional regulator [Streptomyces]ADI11493.1 MerR family transcriptional regulator [Streptomyces bingchenggensis BCW-1]